MDWASLRAKLPFEETDKDEAKRRKLFEKMDESGNIGKICFWLFRRPLALVVNPGNKALTLLECRSGITYDLQLGLLLTKAPLIRAFYKADKEAESEIQFSEFRSFLYYARQVRLIFIVLSQPQNSLIFRLRINANLHKCIFFRFIFG